MPAARRAAFLTALTLALGACGGPPTPHLWQPDPEAVQPSGGDGGTPPGPGGPAPTPGSPTTPPLGPNPGAPPPATAAPPPTIPAGLVGTWTGDVAGARMTKVLRADATYSESWADASAPCQAEGTLQISGGTVTLIPRTTTCTWRVVTFQFTVNGPSLTLTSGGIDQEYTRA